VKQARKLALVPAADEGVEHAEERRHHRKVRPGMKTRPML
jgi:hypothetical protein